VTLSKFIVLETVVCTGVIDVCFPTCHM